MAQGKAKTTQDNFSQGKDTFLKVKTLFLRQRQLKPNFLKAKTTQGNFLKAKTPFSRQRPYKTHFPRSKSLQISWWTCILKCVSHQWQAAQPAGTRHVRGIANFEECFADVRFDFGLYKIKIRIILQIWLGWDDYKCNPYLVFYPR